QQQPIRPEQTKALPETQVSVPSMKTVVARPAVVSPLAKTPTGIGRLKLVGDINHLAMLTGHLAPEPGQGLKIAGDLELRGTRAGIEASVKLAGRDGEKEYATVDAFVKTDWALNPSTLNLKELSVSHRKDIQQILQVADLQWNSLDLSGQLTSLTGGMVKTFAFTGKGTGLRSAAYLPDDVKVDLDLSGAVELPQGNWALNRAQATAKVYNGAGPIVSLDLQQTNGKLLFGAAWAKSKPIAITASGTWDPAFLMRNAAVHQPAVATVESLVVRSDLMVNPAEGVQGRVAGLYGGKTILTASPQFSWKERKLAFRAMLLSVPAELAAVVMDPQCMPRFESLELKARFGGVAGVPLSKRVEVRCVAQAKGFADRGAVMRPGKLSVDVTGVSRLDDGLHFEQTPLLVTWEELIVMDAPVDAVVGLNGCRLKSGDARFPATTFFAMLNPAVLPPTRECTGGDLVLTVDCSAEKQAWDTSVKVEVENLTFIDPGTEKEVVGPVTWTVELDGMGSPDGKRELAVKSLGSSRSNQLMAQAEWQAGQRWPTMIRVQGESPNFDVWYDAFARPRKFQMSSAKDGAVSKKLPELREYLAGMLPTDKEIASFNADYAVNISDLEMGPLDFEDVKFVLIAENGVVRCPAGSMEVNGADVTWSGALVQEKGKTDLNMALACDEVSLTPFFSVLYPAEKDEVRGLVSTDLQVVGSGENLIAAVMTATGSGKLRIEDSYFYPIPALSGADQRLAMPDLERLGFDEISGPITVQGGQLRVAPLQMMRDEGKLVLTLIVRPDVGCRVRGIVKPYINPKHYAKYLVTQSKDLFGVDQLTREAAGYSLEIPVDFLRNGVNWSQDTMDKHALEPIKNSEVGKFLKGLFSRKK
ncbi:hypothetical protein BVY04_03995, partial [bacterium M21]